MSLKEQMVADAHLFTNPDDFGEQVWYLPKGTSEDADGFPVDIQFQHGSALVDGQLLAIETDGSLLLPKVSVPVVRGGDKFRRPDGTMWHIDNSSVRGSDDVFWRLQVNQDPQPTFRGV
jgi:hypothetical protein